VVVVVPKDGNIGVAQHIGEEHRQGWRERGEIGVREILASNAQSTTAQWHRAHRDLVSR
jgi:hypothetical protein